jgi:hypothetical protein
MLYLQCNNNKKYMTKGFIKNNLSTIKQLLISNGLVDENWEPGEIEVAMSKWG